MHHFERVTALVHDPGLHPLHAGERPQRPGDPLFRFAALLRTACVSQHRAEARLPFLVIRELGEMLARNGGAR